MEEKVRSVLVVAATAGQPNDECNGRSTSQLEWDGWAVGVLATCRRYHLTALDLGKGSA